MKGEGRVRIRVRITLVSLVRDRIVLGGCNLEEAFQNEGVFV